MSSTRLLEGLSILVVEDEAIISFLLEDILNELGAGEVRIAGNVANALAMIDSKRPDLAVLDVNLGGDRAYPVAGRLKADGVPFVFTTGYGKSGLDTRWMAETVVQKPFTVPMMAEALRARLRR
ncbi:MAG: response regulator [Alphaproteobacteria bacterium]|nr:response regulator [Alphaproteobacteria bacterium]MBL6936523.1 response regulator [Alphaproteobacteria bacterium]MBL7098426.1 response regulator [Alphaproteobacteria bacterium]